MKPEEQQPKEQAAKKPGKEDVHEQREDAQPHEGTVSDAPAQNPPPRH